MSRNPRDLQVAEGVFQFKIPMPTNPRTPGGGLRYTLVYLIHTTEGWVVVDAGVNTQDGFDAFRAYLAEIGVEADTIKVILITHGHADHVGLANRFKELTGARLAMHKLDAMGAGHNRGQVAAAGPQALHWFANECGVPDTELQEGFLPRQLPPQDANESPWRPPAPDVDMLLNGGEELIDGSGLWTIWTPGHSPGHLCIHDKKRRLLFSGDHVLPNITPHVSLYPGDDGDPLGTFLDGQRTLKTLDVDMVHPAHEYSFSDLRQRVDDILQHHDERMDEMVAQVRENPKTAWQIASAIKWNVASWEGLGPASRRMALMETVAHLHHMVIGGKLERQEQVLPVLYSKL